jgi:hypothetical protein
MGREGVGTGRDEEGLECGRKHDSAHVAGIGVVGQFSSARLHLRRLCGRRWVTQGCSSCADSNTCLHEHRERIVTGSGREFTTLLRLKRYCSSWCQISGV